MPKVLPACLVGLLQMELELEISSALSKIPGFSGTASLQQPDVQSWAIW